MKKLLLILTLLFTFLIPLGAFAADPVITSDTRTFNPMSGEYKLKGHVYVKIAPGGTEMIITGDETSVLMYSMEVHGKGNIGLSYGDVSFKCDTVDVYHSKRTAFVQGKCIFKDGDTTITSDKASYCWKTKIATFEGNVAFNGEKKGEKLTYNVIEHKIIDEPVQ